VVVLPATGASPRPDPVFWLHGGPGAAATDMVPAAHGGFFEPLAARDHSTARTRRTSQGNRRSDALRLSISE